MSSTRPGMERGEAPAWPSSHSSGGPRGAEIMRRSELKTVAEIEFDVRAAVLSDRDRSLERTVEIAVAAGIEHERARISAILELSVPPGLERALLVLALSPATTPEQASAFFSKFPLDPAHSANLRKGFRVVERREEM